MPRKVLALLVAVAWLAPAHAIVVRHDREAAEFVVEDDAYPALFHLYLTPRGYRECVATLIAPRWAVTAAHCAEGMERRGKGGAHPVTVGGVPNAVTEIHTPGSGDVDPDPGRTLDVALLKLEKPVKDVEPVPLFDGDDGAGRIIQVIGWGDSGTGLTGPTGNDLALRLAENRITEIDPAHIKFRFDAPESGEALPREGISGPGDSGGPALIELEDGRLAIAGISHGQMGGGPGREGRYGVVEVYVRVKPLLDWMTSTMED